MEHHTTQGGETTLVFDEQEKAVLAQLGKRFGTPVLHLTDTITRLRQADPLASFSDLVNRLPAVLSAIGTRPKQAGAGVAPAAAADPLAALETDIRRRLSAGTGGGNATSQMQQTDAILLQALATCLQTRVIEAVLQQLEMTQRERANG